ncbi:hypothetical protein ASPSYDRAFT_47304 [Aspergillus sydowii CBS 593.65]|uniref:Uncharacterized protein n=1 Tax=Aspergillus sydowii CBS 593.65 TaxID=1036612 RepID=A0A1L9TC62_9EURO|nr:uncharacterized protein ASPSYDRAFT_47304 [Aspergillus sydowii CBS 593.65]OJJ57024.1 hypothetical protein ASPSYDRAFT_47304 [Aspergillus sydowii CBS 593.65]
MQLPQLHVRGNWTYPVMNRYGGPYVIVIFLGLGNRLAISRFVKAMFLFDNVGAKFPK